MVRKKCLVLLVVLCFLLIFSSHASADTLWDQPLSTINTQAYFNQTFVPADPTDSWLADDFVSLGTWEISTIFVPGDFWYIRYYSNLLNADMLHWYIYEDDGGKPAGYPGSPAVPFWSTSLDPSDPQVSLTKGSENLLSNVTLNLDTPITLAPAGTYWLIFYPEVKWLLVGGHGRQFSDTTFGSPAMYIMPGDGDPEPLPDVWTSVLDIAWQDYGLDPLAQGDTSQQDLAFRLEGTITDASINVDPWPEAVFPMTLIDVASTPKTVTVSNPGLGNLTIDTITVTGTDADDFTVSPGDTDGCALTNQVLASGDSCTLSVTFTPSAAGAAKAFLQISSDAADANLVSLQLSGIGTGAQPSVTEGTIGTEITFTASPSSTFGIKKGKALIYKDVLKSPLKIAKGNWSATEITGTVRKALESGKYSVQIKVPGSTTPIDIPGGFTFKKPEVDPLEDSDGAPGEEIEVKGKFFGSKKPKVYLEYTNAKGVDKKKYCKITELSWNAQTGVSSLFFVVPKGLEAGRSYPLRVETKKVGTSVESVSFTILAPAGL